MGVAGDIEDVTVVTRVKKLEEELLGLPVMITMDICISDGLLSSFSPVILGEELCVALLCDVWPQPADPRLQEPESEILHLG